jgi:CHAT domain-containing protein
MASLAQDPRAAALEARAEQAEGRGALGEAAGLWEQAGERYAREGDAGGELRALLRRGELERDLGRARDARESLLQALALATPLGPAYEAAARGALGGALAAAGEVDAGVAELRRAEALAATLEDAGLSAAIANELGRARAEGGDRDAAAEAFTRAARSPDASLAFRALANRAALASEEPLDARLAAWVEEAARRGEPLPPSHADAQAWARLARAAARLAGRSGEAGDAARANACFERALAQARELDDPVAATWALGFRAEALLAAGDAAAARASAEAALREARRARLADAELAWLALLGRLERGAGGRERAIAHLTEASELLVLRRASAKGRSPGAPAAGADVQLELVDLLLEAARERGDDALRQADLRLAQRTLERFKAAELRDYFRDGCVDAYREKIRDPATASPTAAVLYPIVLPDRLELLVSSRAGIRQFTVPVAREDFEAEVSTLGRTLRDRTSFGFVDAAQRLHAWLIAPALAHLTELGADTLVFVPGGSLRTVPMAALYDGETFLIERFAVATTPGLELTEPRSVDAERISVFLGGLSEGVQGFAPLGHVPEELGAVQERYGGTLLLDGKFTTPRVRSTLGAREFSVVHIATHGRFGARPEDTFLLTHDGRLSMDELAESVGAFRFREQPLELILLSACETAVGDERAALGLAGVAVKAGARSAIGSLWKVNDEATALLIDGFYRELAEPGVSRARALQRAQQAVAGDLRYRHPGFWSPFLLIGNWL